MRLATSKAENLFERPARRPDQPGLFGKNMMVFKHTAFEPL